MTIMPSEIAGLPAYSGSIAASAVSPVVVSGKIYKRNETSNPTVNTGDTSTATGTGGTSTATSTTRFSKITTDAITTASAATHVMTVTNTNIAATDIVQVSLARGTASAGILVAASVVPGSGSVVITLYNTAAAAVNGTYILSVQVIKVA